MADLDVVLARVANDPAFADAVRNDPTNALRGYQLDASELSRLEHALGVAPGPGPSLFAPGSEAGAGGGAAGMGAMGLLFGGLAVAGLVGGAALGFGTADDGGGRGASLRADAVTVHACSDAVGAGAPTGTLHRGDRVWVIGRADGGWLVVRHPDNVLLPGWVRAADLVADTNTAGLEALTCEQAQAEAAVPDPGDTTVTTVETSGTTPDTTTTVGGGGGTTDTSGPTINVGADHGDLYSEDGRPVCAAYHQQLTVTATASDPSGATVTAVTWSIPGNGGSASALGGNQWRVGPVYWTGGGTTTMTITVNAVDGKGNTSSKNLTITFRQIAETCIG